VYLLTPLFPGSPHFLNCRVLPVSVPQEQHPVGETSEDALNEEFDNRVPFSLRHRSLHRPLLMLDRLELSDGPIITLAPAFQHFKPFVQQFDMLVKDILQ
jgi:hypothetical protein